LAYLAEDEGTLAGAIAVRLEKHQRMATKARMYIMTLGVYAMYRSRGIGSRLLTTSLNEASEDENVVDAYLHVQTNNDLAIKFYCDRFGFERGDVIEKYYKRIEPDSAVVLRLDMSTWKRRSIENARFDYDNSIE
jgi:N-alpha-acetyltransferase 50